MVWAVPIQSIDQFIYQKDARHPLKYRMLVGMVDTIFADVAQPDQVIQTAKLWEGLSGGVGI